MTEMIIWLPEDLSLPWAWCLGERSGRAATDEEKSALSDMGASSLNMVIDGRSVRIFEHDLPKMRESDRLAAARFSVENQVAAALGEQHMVLASGEDKRVAVIADKKMQTIKALCAEFSLIPEGLYADFDALNSPDDAPVFLEDRAIYSGPLGYTVDPDWVEGGPYQTLSHTSLTDQFNFNNAINLLSGRYVKKHRLALDAKLLTRLAALLAITFVAGLGWLYAHNQSIHSEADFLSSETARIYTEHMGEAAPSNPALAVTRALRNNQGQEAGFIELSVVLYKGIETMRDIRVEMIQYDEKKGQLSLRLIYPSFESTTEFEEAIKLVGGVLDAGGVREQGGKLIGEASLRLGGGA